MQGTILLNYNENLKQVEQEEMHRFLHSVLDEMGVPVQEIWENPVLLTVEQKIKLRDLLYKYNVQVFEDLDGGLQVFVDNQLIAEWYKCTYKIKKDPLQRDPKKRFFLEMAVNYWTIFEQEQNNNEN
jgi:hypothetical protein